MTYQILPTVPVFYYKNFLGDYNNRIADACLEDLKKLDWNRVDNTPRSEYYCNDIQVPYTYGSGGFMKTYQVQPWNSTLLMIRQRIESMDYAYTDFETCFLNRYHNQLDHLGWHADDSPEMDDHKPIAIVSFGVEREIWFRSNDNPKEVTKLKLEHGSLCLMDPGMQDTHQHRIPKASFECGERISLTFRGFVQ